MSWPVKLFQVTQNLVQVGSLEEVGEVLGNQFAISFANKIDLIQMALGWFEPQCIRCSI